jgi:hypothetical protein
MTTRTYAVLNANAVGPLLLLDASNLQVSISPSVAINGNRMILGDLAQTSGESSYEIYFWSTLRASLAGLISFGVTQPDVALTNFVGGDSVAGVGKSWGFRVADGTVWNNNASVGTAQGGAQVERTCLGLHVNLSPSLCTCDWTVNGTPVYTATLPNGKAWLPAISLGAAAGDTVSAVINFGQNRTDQSVYTQGWWQQAPGLQTLYLALATEGFLSAAADTPANTSFGPFVLNPSQISITRLPQAWFQRSGGRSNPAALTAISLDNSRGTFNALIGADVRDSAVVLQVINAPAGGAGSLATASTMFTGILDTLSAPDASTVVLTLRDSLARFDKPCPVRIVPPFFDVASAGKIYPIGLGAQRNVLPLLLDAPTQLYALGDAPMSNVAVVSDNAAPLDPYASPPQYEPALNGAGLILATDVVGRLAVDCSNVGAQYTIPGAADVLNGDGNFEVWSGTPSRPANFIESLNVGGGTGGSFTRTGSAGDYHAQIVTGTAWDPQAGKYASYFATTSAVLLSGRSYRISVRVLQTSSGWPGDGVTYGGIMLRSDLSLSSNGAISPNQRPIYLPNFYAQTYTFTYTVPAGSARPLYIIAAPSLGFDYHLSNGSASGVVDCVTIELIGQYIQAPLDGITLKDAFTEILVTRGGESPSVFSAADCDAIDALYADHIKHPFPLGFRWEDQPNMLDQMTLVADQFGAVIITDALGVIRVRRLTDSNDGSAIVAAFSAANIDVPTFTVLPETAPGLTTNYGARHNCTPFGPQDFVTDTLLVPASLRAQYQGTSQFNVSASVPLAAEYIGARGAGRLHTLNDNKTATAIEGNRVCALFSAKHAIYQFTARYDGLSLGIGPTVAPQALFYNDKITIDLAEFGWVGERMTVIGTEPFFDNRILITVRH